MEKEEIICSIEKSLVQYLNKGDTIQSNTCRDCMNLLIQLEILNALRAISWTLNALNLQYSLKEKD